MFIESIFMKVGPQHHGHPLCQGGTLGDEVVSVSQLTTVMKLFVLIILIHWLSKALLNRKKWIVSVIVIAFKAVLMFNQCCNKKLEQIVMLIINVLLKKNL